MCGHWSFLVSSELWMCRYYIFSTVIEYNVCCRKQMCARVLLTMLFGTLKLDTLGQCWKQGKLTSLRYLPHLLKVKLFGGCPQVYWSSFRKHMGYFVRSNNSFWIPSVLHLISNITGDILVGWDGHFNLLFNAILLNHGMNLLQLGRSYLQANNLVMPARSLLPSRPAL